MVHFFLGFLSYSHAAADGLCGVGGKLRQGAEPRRSGPERWRLVPSHVPHHSEGSAALLHSTRRSLYVRLMCAPYVCALYVRLIA